MLIETMDFYPIDLPLARDSLNGTLRIRLPEKGIG
jgi:hypothetical protein